MQFVLVAFLCITVLTGVAKCLEDLQELDCKYRFPCHCQKHGSEYTFICTNSSNILEDVRKSGNIENFKISLLAIDTTMDNMPDGYFDGLVVQVLYIISKKLKITRQTLKGIEPYLEHILIKETKTDVVPNLVEFKRLKGIEFIGNHEMFNGTLTRWSIGRLPNDSITEIKIIDCGIRSIDDGVFKRFHKLKKLALSSNFLTTLPNNPFPDNLQELQMWKNLFSSPPTNAILNSKDLNRVYFLSNKFQELKEDEFLPLLKKKCYFMLDDTISCTCAIKWIAQVNEDPNYKGRLSSHCRGNSTRKFKSVSSLTKEDFDDC